MTFRPVQDSHCLGWHTDTVKDLMKVPRVVVFLVSCKNRVSGIHNCLSRIKARFQSCDRENNKMIHPWEKQIANKAYFTATLSRDFNLRFYNIPEDSNENCIENLKTILSNDLGIKPVIENAHRIGGPRTGASNDPRPVIAKFLYRPAMCK